MTLTIRIGLAALLLAFAAPAFAQGGAPEPPDGQQPAAAPAAPAQPEDDPDLDINFAQPDFSVISLPTTLRVPRHRSAFRVTHRFGRPLGQGSFGDLVDDLFGLDSGARIGLEYRFGLRRGTQIGFHRSSFDKTLQLFAQQSILNQAEARPLGLAVIASLEGTNNLHDSESRGIEASYSPSIGLLLSREVADRAAFYIEPFWVNNSNPLPADADNSTFMIGLATRLRVRPTVYLLLEGTPRVSGYDAGTTQVSFGIEKRAGGHAFQLNFGNANGTTPGQIARGGRSSDDWYIGFNISRKFY